MEIDPRQDRGLQAPFGRGLSGFAVGLLHLAGTYPLLPGNPQNASTFDFPVLYEEVVGAEPAAVMRGDPALEPAIVAAARRLEGAGVGAIVGVCGSFAYFQPELAAAVSVPVFSSVLCLTDLVVQTLPQRRKLLVVFADPASDTLRLRRACGMVDDARIVTTGCCDLDEFKTLFRPGAAFDPGAFAKQLVGRIAEVVSADSDVGAILLQCSELAPFAPEVQARFDLPVYDGGLLVRFVHESLAPRRQTGIMTRGARSQ
jgi:hypothetical protein